MITVVQSKIVLGNIVALDSPSVVGHSILIVLSYGNLSQYPVVLSDLVNMSATFSCTTWNYTPDFSNGYGLAVLYGPVTDSGIVSFNYTIETGTIDNLITSIIEFSEDFELTYDETRDYDLGPITFTPVVDGNLCIYCLASNLDDNVITFPIGTEIMSTNGSGALGVAYLVTDEDNKTISGDATINQVLRTAIRFALLADPLTINCGTLVKIGIAE